MIYTQLSNGFGNNMFQYVAAKVMAHYHKTDVLALPPFASYYGIAPLKSLGVNFVSNQDYSGAKPVDDSTYIRSFNAKYNNTDLILKGYFEDHRYYSKMRGKIKTWFSPVERRNDNDLVLHFRAGDRLSYKNEFYDKPKVQDYLSAIEQFDFDRLHIVTDMPKWDRLTVEEFKKMKFHVSVQSDKSVTPEESVEYFNSFVDGFKKFNPIVEKRDVHEDFNFIRSFRNIMFQHGTLSWWAAFLSDADKVGVYGPWRPWKGKSNKNLSQVGFEGWFKWQ